jgi:hypothetical protein
VKHTLCSWGDGTSEPDTVNQSISCGWSEYLRDATGSKRKECAKYGRSTTGTAGYHIAPNGEPLPRSAANGFGALASPPVNILIIFSIIVFGGVILKYRSPIACSIGPKEGSESMAFAYFSRKTLNKGAASRCTAKSLGWPMSHQATWHGGSIKNIPRV